MPERWQRSVRSANERGIGRLLVGLVEVSGQSLSEQRGSQGGGEGE